MQNVPPHFLLLLFEKKKRKPCLYNKSFMLLFTKSHLSPWFIELIQLSKDVKVCYLKWPLDEKPDQRRLIERVKICSRYLSPFLGTITFLSSSQLY